MRGHLPALDDGGMDPAPARYMIRINGHLGATVLSAFTALASRWHGTHTVLAGLLNRSALYGVLAEIEALGLDLLEIRQLTPDRKSPESAAVAAARSLTLLGRADASISSPPAGFADLTPELSREAPAPSRDSAHQTR
jgi:hypothetical protein